MERAPYLEERDAAGIKKGPGSPLYILAPLPDLFPRERLYLYNSRHATPDSFVSDQALFHHNTRSWNLHFLQALSYMI